MSFVHNIRVRNVNEALPTGLRMLANRAAHEPSRNGPVAVMPGPVMTIYEQPTERVLFSPVRDANPFFHLFEALWMLNGERDLPWLVQFNKRFSSYSDDGGLTQPAAYGFRWRRYFGYDQLDTVVEELTRNPGSRRAVLSMWDPGYSLGPRGGNPLEFCRGDAHRALDGSADIPCNTHCYFRVREGRRDMTVCCRSNDVLWGAYGANAVHFSVLQEYLAARLGLAVGALYQLSNNYHVYTEVVGDMMAMAMDAEQFNLYALESINPMPMFRDSTTFDAELGLFMEWAADDTTVSAGELPLFTEKFLQRVAVPMRLAWAAHKSRDYGAAEGLCGSVAADDWRIASRQWMERRSRAWRNKGNG